MTQRVMMDVDVLPLGTPQWDSGDAVPEQAYIAMNDAVVTAGPRSA